MSLSHQILSEKGGLKKTIPDFVPRAAQQQMAAAIEQSLAVKSELIVEAGTGTGKTFAYLIPVLLSDKKSIISTGTKTLQDQLFFKDVPIIKKTLSFKGKIVLLKGRANYLCLHRLHNARQDGRFPSRQIIAQLQTITEWAGITRAGDIAELTDVPEDSSVWPFVTSTTDNCLNQECEFYNQCHVVKARQEALTADVVIVNHHLFFADMLLQEEGFGELLPQAETIIFDEAHHLPEIASHFFSTYLTGRQLNELARDTEAEYMQHAKDMDSLFSASESLQYAVHELRTAMGSDLKRYAWPDRLPAGMETGIKKIKEKLQQLEEILKNAAARTKGLENCWKRSIKLIEKFNLLTSKTDDETIHWYETHAQSFTLQFTPLIIAKHFKNFLSLKKRSWIFTSATLCVKNSFDLFVTALGLENALQLQLKSPFDYQNQALLYVPRGLPDTRSSNYIEKLIEAVIPVIEVTQGKTFILFTSYKAMDQAAKILEKAVNFPLLLQGTLPKRELIEQFKKLGNAVLLGTSSFWYGVDVKGDALSCVIIDKLPFAAPDDPILQARINLLRKQNKDPFTHYQLPQAVLILKQGAGRLIRGSEDRGVLMICDPRISGNRYGEIFLQSLPNMRRTRELTRIKDFFQQRPCHENASH